ncbi:hypothetical protein ACQPZP_33930 [Spirillospora sp. CA-142024]|uniref:hypothetical protein n=1 Tax=Spirillospora sp. CA-142024 TaxID=3240036 RepID=UPI003D93CEAE
MRLSESKTTAIATITFVATAAAAPGPRPDATSVIEVQGEVAARTNIPTAADARASGRSYLALESTQKRGWYATYRVRARTSGAYRLEAFATSPMGRDEDSRIGSYIDLSVNGAPSEQVAGSQPEWARSPRGWGDLYRLNLGDVELRRGNNTITFRVNEATVVDDSVLYRLLLDRFRLTPAKVALRDVRIQDPLSGIGIYRGEEPAVLNFRLNARTTKAWRGRYEITDYFSTKVAAGAVTIPAGSAAASVRIPRLAPGHYTVRASLPSSAPSRIAGRFAHLPARRPVGGSASRFGVNTFVSSLVPSSRLGPLADALGQMGAGYMRDAGSWPAAAPRRAHYVPTPQDQILRTFHGHGLQTLEVLSGPPDWAITPASVPLPSDLRDAYGYTGHLARKSGGAEPDAVQVSNEPDVDDTSSTGDQHAAYVKAAALGVADAPGDRPLIVLPGIAATDPFQRLMLRNDVARYGDAWAFHGYGDATGANPAVPQAAEEQRRLRKRYAAGRPMWMTESGIFVHSGKSSGMTTGQQRVQARYLVRAAVEDLASGVDRHFWFVGPPTHDDGISFGILSPEFQPWPAYSAHAAMASFLGEANFVRRLHRLPRGASGFTFDSGRETVAVLWAAKPVNVDVRGRGPVYNIMGAKERGTANGNGTVRVKVSPDPVYVMSGRAARPPRPRPASRRKTFSTAEHIVLNQRFAVTNSAPGKQSGDAPPPHGYRLNARTRMFLDVYNFTDKPQTVVLRGRATGGWAVRPAGRTTVRIPARGRFSVPVLLDSQGGVRKGRDQQLIFEATLGGRTVPRSASWIQLR